jgi:hypothetical protein
MKNIGIYIGLLGMAVLTCTADSEWTPAYWVLFSVCMLCIFIGMYCYDCTVAEEARANDRRAHIVVYHSKKMHYSDYIN